MSNQWFFCGEFLTFFEKQFRTNYLVAYSLFFETNSSFKKQITTSTFNMKVFLKVFWPSYFEYCWIWLNIHVDDHFWTITSQFWKKKQYVQPSPLNVILLFSYSKNIKHERLCIGGEMILTKGWNILICAWHNIIHNFWHILSFGC